MTDTGLLFDLTPTDDEQMTREVIRRFARDEMAPTARSADEAALLPEGFLDKTVELGMNYMPVPEALGGVGSGQHPVSSALMIEALAQGDMTMTLAALAPLAVINTVMRWGSSAQQQRVAQVLLAEQFAPAAIALTEPGIACTPDSLKTTAIQQADGSWVLTGEKSMVPFGGDASLLLVFANACTSRGDNLGTRGFLLDPATSGCRFEREHYMGLRALPLYRLQLDAVCVESSAELGESAGDAFDLQHFLGLSRIATAALAVGTCQAVLDYVKDYVNERTAFGEPISHRQSVAFMVADMATELQGMRLLAYRAASQAEQGLDYTRVAFLAQRQAIKYGMKIGTDGVQLLGGHGFTREHPVELWYRNLRALPVIEGLLVA